MPTAMQIMALITDKADRAVLAHRACYARLDYNTALADVNATPSVRLAAQIWRVEPLPDNDPGVLSRMKQGRGGSERACPRALWKRINEIPEKELKKPLTGGQCLTILRLLDL